MNGFTNLNESDNEYLLAPTDDLVRFWRSEIEVTAGRGKDIHVDAGA